MGTVFDAIHKIKELAKANLQFGIEPHQLSTIKYCDQYLLSAHSSFSLNQG
jgi:hypothetical protein